MRTQGEPLGDQVHNLLDQVGINIIELLSDPVTDTGNKS